MIRSTSLSAVLAAGRRHLALPAAGLLLGLAVGQAATMAVEPSYRASAWLLVTSAGAETGGRQQQDPDLVATLAPTVANLVASREVAVDVADALGLPVDRVAGRLRGEVRPGTRIVAVTATAADPGRAADIANTAAGAVGRQLNRARPTGDTTVLTRLVDQAGPPETPEYPRPALNAVFGALTGLIAGLGATLLRNRFDDRLRNPARIATRIGLPVLGSVPPPARRRLRHPAVDLYDDVVADRTAAVVAALSVLAVPLAGRRLLVTSADGQDGKALVTALLALGLVEEQHTVTVVDAQLRQPLLTGYFPDAPATLQQVLGGERPVRPLPTNACLTALPAADPEPDGPLRLREETFGALLERQAEQGDVVLVHAPPVLAGSELTRLAAYADGVLLVVWAGATRADRAALAALLLGRLGLPVLGVIAVASADVAVDGRRTTVLGPDQDRSGAGGRHQRDEPWPATAGHRAYREGLTTTGVGARRRGGVYRSGAALPPAGAVAPDDRDRMWRAPVEVPAAPASGEQSARGVVGNTAVPVPGTADPDTDAQAGALPGQRTAGTAPVGVDGPAVPPGPAGENGTAGHDGQDGD